jgi:hypothetical protein
MPVGGFKLREIAGDAPAVKIEPKGTRFLSPTGFAIAASRNPR